MIDAVITRLVAQVAAFKLVGEAADFQAAAETNPTAGPAAFVFMANETGIDTSQTGRARQRGDVNFSVVYAVKNVTNAKGKGNAGSLSALKDATRSALIGWSPAGTIAPIAFTAGNQLAFRQNWQWWADTFKTQILIP